MCELFGVNSSTIVDVTAYLKTFMSHSANHPNGWGIAQFYGNAVSLEKEPKAALVSDYLGSRLSNEVETQNLIAHIRLATRGQMVYDNCHPFVKRDSQGRAWTLAHNGTIFQSEILDHYSSVQKGGTDSERILCHIIQKMNDSALNGDGEMNDQERIEVIDQIICEIAEHNKVNLLIYDGEIMYVHTNMKHTLYFLEKEQTTFFATVPLDEENWRPVPMMRLLAYKNGKQIFSGTEHVFEYIQGDKPPVYDWAVL